ncbi:MAG: GtrA family protein [Syntrophales bacterium]|nr:GtrA family protein [Syntrophales bacterium]
MRKPLWRQHQTKIRFLIVGVWNTIFGYGAFIILNEVFNLFLSPRYMAYMAANVFGSVLGITNAFFFHKHFTFKSRENGWDALREYFRFAGTYLFSFLIGLILLPVFVELLGMTPPVAAAALLLICTVFSYLGHSRFSFRSR